MDVRDSSYQLLPGSEKRIEPLQMEEEDEQAPSPLEACVDLARSRLTRVILALVATAVCVKAATFSRSGVVRLRFHCHTSAEALPVGVTLGRTELTHPINVSLFFRAGYKYLMPDPERYPAVERPGLQDGDISDYYSSSAIESYVGYARSGSGGGGGGGGWAGAPATPPAKSGDYASLGSWKAAEAPGVGEDLPEGESAAEGSIFVSAPAQEEMVVDPAWRLADGGWLEGRRVATSVYRQSWERLLTKKLGNFSRATAAWGHLALCILSVANIAAFFSIPIAFLTVVGKGGGARLHRTSKGLLRFVVASSGGLAVAVVLVCCWRFPSSVARSAGPEAADAVGQRMQDYVDKRVNTVNAKRGWRLANYPAWEDCRSLTSAGVGDFWARGAAGALGANAVVCCIALNARGKVQSDVWSS